MTLFSYVLGGAGFGLAARLWQLGIMKRNLADNLGGHALSMVAWAGAGAFFYDMNERNIKIVEEKKAELRRMRALSLGQEAPDES